MMFISPVIPAIRFSGEIFEFEHDRIPLRFGISRRYDRGDAGRELLRAVGVELDLRFHSCFNLSDVLFIYFAADIILREETVNSSLPSATNSPSIV